MAVTATYPLQPGIPGTPTSKGGEIPLAPFATDDFRVSIRRAPTKDEIFDILKRVTEPSYHTPIIEDPRGAIALYRAAACMHQVVADKGFRSQQSTFYLPYPTQGEPPASSLVSATMDVQLQRTKNRDVNLTAEIGTIILFGPGGRTYVNAERVVWSPFDSDDLKTVEFICQQPGFVGNLDFLADDNGLITNPDGTPATDIVGFQRQGGTTNVFADIIGNASGLSSMRDQGRPDTFSEADVGLYVEILAAANADNVGRLVRVVDYSEPGVENPANSGLFPTQILVDDGPVQTQIFAAISDDGSLTFVNETAAARSSTPDDMNLIRTPGVNDTYYFGGTRPFGSLDLTLSTPGVGTWEIEWQYSQGGGWEPLNGIVDDTVGFTNSGTNNVRWSVPADWTTDTVDGVLAYYVRALVTSFTSSTTQPLGQIAYLYEINQLTPEQSDEQAATPMGYVQWAIRDWTDLGVEIVQINAPTGGRDNTLRLLGEERGVYQQDNESDDQFRQRAARLAEAVSPNAIQNTVDRALEPFGLTGLAIDTAIGGTFETFSGFFWDEDFWDYYNNPFVGAAISDDGGVGTDQTAEAASETANDMTLLPATVAVADAYFFGNGEVFDEVQVDITTPGIGDWVIEWRYFNGISYVALSNVDDGTDAFKNPGVRSVTFDVPGDWATESPFGIGPLYYVHARVTSVTTTTQQPLGRQARIAFQYPTDKYKLPLSISETLGWFFVILPCLPDDSDFGFAWDINEPANLLDGQILASAWDIGVYDGEPTAANAAYAEIYNQIDRIRAGGVGFTIIRDCDLNVPACP